MRGRRLTVSRFILIIAAPLLVPSLVMPETWAPLLLKRKAARLRFETKDWSLHSKLDEHPVELEHLLRTYGLKPMQMLFQEPILAAVPIYNAFIYAVMYLTFAAYPYALVWYEAGRAASQLYHSFPSELASTWGLCWSAS